MLPPSHMLPSKAPKPAPNLMCIITGRPAKYRDPISGHGYADLAAYKELKERWNNDRRGKTGKRTKRQRSSGILQTTQPLASMGAQTVSVDSAGGVAVSPAGHPVTDQVAPAADEQQPAASIAQFAAAQPDTDAAHTGASAVQPATVGPHTDAILTGESQSGNNATGGVAQSIDVQPAVAAEHQVPAVPEQQSDAVENAAQTRQPQAATLNISGAMHIQAQPHGQSEGNQSRSVTGVDAPNS